MTTPAEIGQDFAQVLREAGRVVRFRYFTSTYPGAGSYYDDDVTLAKSGADLFVSGVVLPVGGVNDAHLLEQGRILQDDQRLYVAGSIQTSGLYKVGMGSPPVGEYSSVSDGMTEWEVGGTNIFKKIFIRVLPTGSLAEE